MCDLNFPITSVEEAARYFQLPTEIIEEAIEAGAHTYEELERKLRNKDLK
jgi:hypothetical protein